MASLVIAAILFASIAFAQSPAGFSPGTTERLFAAFDGNSSKNVTSNFFIPGGIFSRGVTNVSVPALFLQSNQTSLGTGALPITFVLCMVDPDAPSPSNTSASQILHWLQPGLRPLNSTAAYNELVPRADTREVPAIAAYRGPAPPSVEPHRYILLLFRQPNPNSFEMPSSFSQFNNSTRGKFDVGKWAEAASLGSPVAATYFMVGRDTVGDGTQTDNLNGNLQPSTTTGSRPATPTSSGNTAARLDSQLLLGSGLGITALYFGLLM